MLNNEGDEIKIYDFAGHCSNCNDEIIRSFHILIPVLENPEDHKGYLALCQDCAHDWLHQYLCPAQEKNKTEDTDNEDEGSEI